MGWYQPSLASSAPLETCAADAMPEMAFVRLGSGSLSRSPSLPHKQLSASASSSACNATHTPLPLWTDGQGDLCPPSQHMPQKNALRPGGTSVFIQVKHPGDTSWRSAVRSQAATARHAAARRRRMLEHQQLAEAPELEREGCCRVERGPMLVRDPESLCMIRSVDPFDCAVRSTTRFECFLMNHCRANR
jgi:hypothetical protein